MSAPFVDRTELMMTIVELATAPRMNARTVVE
jgi:hypothetical protein